MNNRSARGLVLRTVAPCSFQQAYQLVSTLAGKPGVPRTAAYLSLLFLHAPSENSLDQLRSWLQRYVSGFVGQPVRDQSEQAEKVLAVIAYLLTAHHTNYFINSSTYSQLVRYINYARNQLWFDDTLIPFVCYFLKSEAQACQDASDYFRDKLHEFVSRGDIPAICQALIVLNDQVSPSDRQLCDQAIARFIERRPESLHDTAWLLWSAQFTPKPPNQETASELANAVTTKLDDYISVFLKETQLFRFLALLLFTDFQDFVDSDLGNDAAPTVRYNADDDVVSISVKPSMVIDQLAKTFSEAPAIADISLALTSLSATGWHNLTGVAEVQKNQLITVVREAQKLSEGGTVFSKSELALANILAIVAELILGAVIFGFFLNARITISLDLSQVSLPDSLRDIDLSLLLIAVYMDHLIGQISALRSGRSAIEGILQIPILRHFGRFRNAAEAN